MNARGADRVGADIAGELSSLGYDYIKLPLAGLARLHGDLFEELARRLEGHGLRCEVCNIMFPPSIRLFGGAKDDKLVDAYLEKAFGRARRLGVQCVVFGIGVSRTVPEGVDKNKAWERLAELTGHFGDVAESYGITLVIEPLRREECNTVNSVAEGLRLAQCVDSKNVRLLVDYYHLACEGESPDVLLKAADYIEHVHIAKPEGRVFPVEGDFEEFAPFFDALRAINYDGRVSVEAYTRDFRRDAAASLDFRKKHCGIKSGTEVS